MNSTPWRITFDTNPDDCNLRCVMCEQHSPHSSKRLARSPRGQCPRRMSIDVIRRVLNELRGDPPKEIIPSTMGEPLLYEHFETILKLCKEHGCKLNLTTNGTFPGKGVRKWAELILPVGSDIKVSINGVTSATQEKIMQKSKHHVVVSNLKTLVEMRDALAARQGNYCSITLQVTFMEVNLNELPGIVRLAAELNADRVKGHHLWVHFPEMRDQDLRRDSASIQRWNQVVEECNRVAQECPRRDGRAVKLEHFTPLERKSDGLATQTNTQCPFLGREAWVNHEGRFDPCCAPDERRKSLGFFGLVQDEGFLSIWNGTQYRALVEGYKKKPLCQQCLMRRPLSS